MKGQYLCLVCDESVSADNVNSHKLMHKEYSSYGIMWPQSHSCNSEFSKNIIPIYTSTVFAQALGVESVYIRDEGENFSGSMKDYSVERALSLGVKSGYEYFTVVSSGNHAFSLAKYANLCSKKAIVFMPATSSKLDILSSLENVYVVAVKDAIFEDVYRLAADINLEKVYNANVTNEFLLEGFTYISQDIVAEIGVPDCILAGVGNGSYLSGIALGFSRMHHHLPQIIPVGMKGAFPFVTALENNQLVYEQEDFLIDESTIDAAEGSIAIASYSMPQLVKAVHLSKGFPLGGLVNTDLTNAYELLLSDRNLLDHGVIPEPTGIMGLAAAIKYKERLDSKSRILISFTGHGVKDLSGIKRLISNKADHLCQIAIQFRPELQEPVRESENGNVLYIEKDISKKALVAMLESWIAGIS